MTEAGATGSTDQTTTLITAVAAVLLRACNGRAQPGDAETARRLTSRMVEAGVPDEIMAVATGGVWAAFRPEGELDQDTTEEIATVARAFLDYGGYDGLIALSSASLILMARHGMTETPGRDMVAAARGAWELEHHQVALSASSEAIVNLELSRSDLVQALTLVARITGDQHRVEQLTGLARPRNADSSEPFTTEQIRALTTSGASAAPDWDAARDALVAGDRRAAASHMSSATRSLQTANTRDRAFLDALAAAFDSMDAQSVDVPALRGALTDVVRHLRQRQRFGNVPPAVRAALEIAIMILIAEPSEEAGSILCELLEALADAGLSEVALADTPDASLFETPAETEARLVELATAFPLWPDLENCVEGLEGNFALLCRRIGGGASSTERWISLFIIPPGGVLIKNGPISARHATLMQAFAAGDFGAIDAATPSDIDDFLNSFIHTQGLDALRDQPSRGLIVIPDGDQWSVPWHAAQSMSTRSVTLTPSMAFYAALAPRADRIRTVTALIDDSVDGADILIDELLAARSAGALTVDFAPGGLDRPSDLLLVLGHGSGEGLRFNVSLPYGQLDALEIARRSKSNQTLVASCWSAKAPPVALPLNLSVGLLMRGASLCIGGAWPLPQRDTAILLADAVRGVTEGADLEQAVYDARSTRIGRSWGLMATGRIAPWMEERDG